ncbi:MAG: hypothetical protein JOY55_14515 [Mycobacterium sp.]|nr:hypothetical protein [Mycobacterium sp.]
MVVEPETRQAVPVAVGQPDQMRALGLLLERPVVLHRMGPLEEPAVPAGPAATAIRAAPDRTAPEVAAAVGSIIPGLLAAPLGPVGPVVPESSGIPHTAPEAVVAVAVVAMLLSMLALVVMVEITAVAAAVVAGLVQIMPMLALGATARRASSSSPTRPAARRLSLRMHLTRSSFWRAK